MGARIIVSLALVIVGGVGHAIEACGPDAVPVLDRAIVVSQPSPGVIVIDGVLVWSCAER